MMGNSNNLKKNDRVNVHITHVRPHEEVKSMERRLTYRQMLFCNYYLLTLGNGSQSARLAGYSKVSCRREATRMKYFLSVRIYFSWYYSVLLSGTPRTLMIDDLMDNLDRYRVSYNKSDIERISKHPPMLSFDDLDIHGKANKKFAKELYGKI